MIILVVAAIIYATYPFLKRLIKRAPKKSNKTVDELDVWEVRWNSRYGSFYDQTRPEVNSFASMQSAKDFKLSLENAFKLIKITSGDGVTLKKR